MIEQALQAIADTVGPRWIRTDPVERETYASDGLPTLHLVPAAVILPGSREELVRVVRILHHFRIPFVPRGAGTGLSGGALGKEESVVISLMRLNRILEIDAVNRLARVEPGVVNARLSEAARPHGLQYAPDPSSQTACTIGGNVAENAGGPHCLKYGVTSNHILELEVVLPCGDVVRLGSPAGEPWGLDLVSLFVGSEGMFGIATEITVRLIPVKPVVRTLLADFTSIDDAAKTVAGIIRSGIIPAALEMMDQNCIIAVEDSVYSAGYPRDAAAVLLVELDGDSETGVGTETATVRGILTAGRSRSIREARDEKTRARLWQGRKKAFGALGRISPDLIVQDAVVPRSRLPDVLREIAGIARRYDVTVSNVFHAGDGNLHPNINFDRSDSDQTRRVSLASADIMRACIDAGGTITGEHGVGIDKKKYMPELLSPDTLAAMHAVRTAFDPEHRANPGKVYPVHACREWFQAPALRPAGTGSSR